MTRVGSKIRHIREIKNYTQEHMARELGMSTTGYGKIERDETDLTLTKLEKIAEILNTSFKKYLILMSVKYTISNTPIMLQ